MGFLDSDDLKLVSMVIEIVELMENALKQIEICENSETSDFNTKALRRDIKRFIEDWE